MTVGKSRKSRHRSLMVKLDNAPYRQSEWNVTELFPAFLSGTQFMNYAVLQLQKTPLCSLMYLLSLCL